MRSGCAAVSRHGPARPSQIARPHIAFASRDGETIESLPKCMVSIDRRQYLDGASTISWNGSGCLEVASHCLASGTLGSAKRRNPAPSSHRRRAAGASGRSGAEGTSLSNHDLHGVKVGYEISFTLDRLAHLAGKQEGDAHHVASSGGSGERLATDQGKPLLDEEGRPKTRMGRARPDRSSRCRTSSTWSRPRA